MKNTIFIQMFKACGPPLFNCINTQLIRKGTETRLHGRKRSGNTHHVLLTCPLHFLPSSFYAGAAVCRLNSQSEIAWCTHLLFYFQFPVALSTTVHQWNTSAKHLQLAAKKWLHIRHEHQLQLLIGRWECILHTQIVPQQGSKKLQASKPIIQFKWYFITFIQLMMKFYNSIKSATDFKPKRTLKST